MEKTTEGVLATVASKPLKRTMRSLLAASTVMMTVSLAPGSIADPAPTNAADAQKQFEDLSKQGEQLAEQMNKVTEEIDHKKAEAESARSAAQQAVKDQGAYRDQVDQIAAQAYTNGQMNSMGALLTAKDPGAMLNQMSMLDALTYNNKSAISTLQQKVTAADEADKKLAKALKDTEQLRKDQEAKKADLDKRKDELDAIFKRLSAAEKKAVHPAGALKVALTGSGLGVSAANFAQSRLGDAYVWGGTQPGGFDCSGLVQWAYRQAGVSLPRVTNAQAGAGVSISKGQLQTGDLIFLGSDLYHVGIYLGGNQWVHAPTTGDVVKVANVPWGQVSAMTHVQ
ncbi:hypothetical protein D5S17_30935 [Pseudonocardiaceae bacterium YIM PH 21723]|nr:hypothetical protein D5S17_30935 [Pseudonocardiaceae bacterium YIM PH 21723]